MLRIALKRGGWICGDWDVYVHANDIVAVLILKEKFG